MDDFETVTLFVEDLSSAKSSPEAGELVEPLSVGGRDNAPRVLFTIRVSDVDAKCRELEDQGIGLLNGPIDRPWGRRTAAFSDTEGNVWELAQEI